MSSLAIFYAAAGYLSGSVLYAYVWSSLLKRGDIFAESKDKNPGTANAFQYGGFLCGVLTLLCDILKGYLPVHFYMTTLPSPPGAKAAVVLAAPVAGHVFSVFHKFRGGKGIAVTFGCLLGLGRIWEPFAAMAVSFLFFSLILCITPHFYRTVASYLNAFLLLCLLFHGDGNPYILGFLIITAAVLLGLHRSCEQREKVRVRLPWTS